MGRTCVSDRITLCRSGTDAPRRELPKAESQAKVLLSSFCSGVPVKLTPSVQDAVKPEEFTVATVADVCFP